MKKSVDGIIVDMTAEEIAQKQADETAWNNGAFDRAMKNLRAKRDKDLLESDWTQLGDTTLTNDQKQAWMRFRTQLRDITKGLTTIDDVNNLDYPDKPNG